MADLADQNQEQEDDEYLHEAANAIKAIRAGTASTIPPFEFALYGRMIVEKWFTFLARVYTSSPSVALLLFAAVIVTYGVFCVGFVRADTESAIEELFIRVDDKENLDYTARFISSSSTLELVLQYRPQPNLDRTDFTNTLLDHIEVMRSVIDLPVTFKGRTYTYRDLCAYAPFPPSGMGDFDRIMNTLHICALFSPLDCYWEGSLLQNPPESVVVERPTYCPEMDDELDWGNFNYTQFIDCLENNPNMSNFSSQYIQGIRGLEIEGYVGKNCFVEEECFQLNYTTNSRLVEPDSNLFRKNDTCKGAHNGVITANEIVTGYEGTDDTTDQLRAFRTDLILGSPDLVRSNLQFNGIEISHVDTLGLLERWKERFSQHVKDYNDGKVVSRQNRTSKDLLYGISSVDQQNLIDDVSVIVPALLVTGYVLMVLYCGLAFFKFDPIESRTGAGLVGVLIIFLGTGGTLGITAFAGIKFSLLTVQIYPFLVLGLGVDDMFVIVGTFLEIELKKGRNAPIKELIKETMVAVGPSITLTSVTNFVGFLLGYVIPFLVFRNFVIEVAIAIALNYIGLVIAMPCYLILDYYRSHGMLMDVFCCIPVWWRKEKKHTTTIKEVPDKTEESTKSDFMATVLTWMSTANKEYNSILTWFIANYYSPFLQNYIVKAIAMVLFCIVLGISIWGCTKIEFDVEAKDFGPDGSDFVEYAEIDDEFFQIFTFSIVTREINYPGLQPQLLEMERRVSEHRNVLAPTISNRLWLRVMIEFFQFVQNNTCSNSSMNNTDILGRTTAMINAIEPDYFRDEPLCANITPPPALPFSQECLCTYDFLTVEEFRGAQFTVIPRDKFYSYLTIWATLDGISLSLLQSFLLPAPARLNFSDFVPSPPLQYAHLNLIVDDLRTTEIAVDYIEDIDDIIDDLGIDGYNLGRAILVYSQFVSLREEMLIAAAIIVFCCFIVTTLFLMDIHSGIIMGAILTINAVEVLGYMGHFNIPLNFFAATVYLAGIAIGVEFTAPLVFYFLKATASNSAHTSSDLWVLKELGRRNERMHKALEHRFTAIFNGSVTTFVGVVMLFFAPVRFIRVFFFGVLMIVVMIGLINGLIFLPVLLSIIGPFAQVWPTDTVTAEINIPNKINGISDEVVENREASTSI